MRVSILMYYLRGDFLILLVVLLVCGLKCSHGAAFLTPPRQPAGLSSEAIVDLARNRFGEKLLKDRVVVITGAAGGIGRQLCQVVIHELGGTVVALDRNVTGLELLRQEYNSCDNNLRLDTIPTCHEDLSSVASSAQRIKEKYPKIDVLINNAGMAYSADRPPGLSAHGHDLAFTVNYLSHFLLTEALLPCLGSDGRIVFMTSTYHWKVSGSELMVADEEEESKSKQKDNTNIMNGPMAYQGVPENQSPKHVERSYGNTKLAQIWQARTLCSKGVSAVCACPTWVGTGIGGEGSREMLERLAFPVDGAGITSAINAMLRTDEELKDVLNGECIVANSRILEWLPTALLTNRFFQKWRDGWTDACGLLLLLGQRFTHESFIVQKSSPESYNQPLAMQALHDWSTREVSKYIE
mmetsp:Transcript_23631/g.42622  ORF Transcript_23631/g.42622 Transcript_23631/m.42622 type:complete len:411 (-) Transcript_23631:711-1943(-)